MSIISDTTVELVPVPFAAPSSSSFECGFDHELDFESLRLIISQNHDDSEKNCQLGMDVSWFDDGGSGVGSEGSGVGDGDTTRSTTSGDTTRSTTTNDTNISIHHNFQLEESNLNSFLTSRNEAQYYHYYYLQNLQNHTNQLTELSNRLKYQLENELKFIPNPNYQHQIQPNSSGINRHQHVNSIIHLCNCLGYELETAWTAVNFFDRYLSKIKLTQKRQFASLIPCCVFVAAKMSEEQPFEPVIADFVSRCDCLTASSMKRMEKKLINVLEWDLNVITPQAVLHQIIADLFPNITNSQQARIIRIADGYFCSYLNGILTIYFLLFYFYLTIFRFSIYRV